MVLGEVLEVGLSGITTSLSLTANFRIVNWFSVVVYVGGGWAIAVWESGGIWNAISLAVGVIFWAAPVVTVKNFSVSSGVVV